ncbi:MAG: hypothetical protein HY769_08575 [Candidatus Stahlbacteria bacterium]|nr:hypothetical protein [Candidatus Stahlbacteria bacterium]
MDKKLLFKRLLFIGIACITITGCRKESPTPPPTPDVVIALTANNDSLPADGMSSLTVTAVVIYSDDNSPATSLIVRFLTTMGKVTQRDTTDSNGIATATLVSDEVAGNSTITAYCENKNKSITIPFYSEAQENVYIASLTATPDTISANGASQSFITAAFKYDGTNEPADSLVVYFNATLGGITYLDTTDANGLATAVLTSSTTYH